MRIKIALFTLLQLCLIFCLQAQPNPKSPFKLRDILVLDDSLTHKWYFLFRFDDRITFIRREPIDIRGVQIGFQKHRFKLWLGAAFINTPTRIRKFTEKTPNSTIEDTIKINTDLDFFSVIPEYVIIWRKYYEVSMALGLGVGFSQVNLESQPKNIFTERRALFLPVEPAIKLAIKPTRWAGLSASIGYRETVAIEQNNVNYSGLFYSYGVSLYLGNIFSDLRRIVRYRKIKTSDNQ